MGHRGGDRDGRLGAARIDPVDDFQADSEVLDHGGAAFNPIPQLT